MLPLPNESKIERMADGFAFINLYDVFDVLYPPPAGDRKYHHDNPEYLEDGWDVQCEKLMEYANQHNLHYYGRPKECFFAWEAEEQARALGKVGVILDNMS